MRKLILKMSISVDGFVGGPNGEIDWLLKSLSEESTAWIVDALWNAGLHIMGSRTFYDMISYWPYSDEPFAKPMNEIPKAVFTRKGIDLANHAATTALKEASTQKAEKGLSSISPDLSSWISAEVITGDLKKEIIRLKQQPGKDILAHGGASFAQSLVKTGLIDEYRLVIHPAALGTGLSLFSGLSETLELELADKRTFKGGAVGHVYRPIKK
jgi:dihydrofolate reductase